MSSLKRVLALTIAMVSLFSLVTFGAWNDEDQIDPQLVDDMKLMQAVNLYKGDNHGNVNPTATITRAEAAKLVYVLKHYGDDDLATGWTGVQSFADVPVGHWAEGYINYCVSIGIVAGFGDGNFYPSRPVTGVELAKMLLVVAGYKPDVQGYVDTAAWSQNVIRDAMTAKLFEHYYVAYTAAAPRQWVARLFSNTIFKCVMPVYFNNEPIITGAFGAQNTVGKYFLGLEQAEGLLTSTGKVGLTEGAPTLTSNGKDSKIGGKTAVGYIADIGLLGQKVVLNYKAKSSNIDDVERVYSVYASSKQDVYSVELSKVTISSAGELSFSGYAKRSYTGKPINLYVDYELQVVGEDDDATSDLTLAQLKANFGFNTNDGRVATLIDYDQDGYIDAAFVSSVQYRKVSNYNASREIFVLTGGPSLDFDDVNFVDAVAKDDVVKLTKDLSSGKVVYNVEKVDAIEGKAGNFVLGKVEDDTVITGATINGTAYKVAANAVPGYTAIGADQEVFYVDKGFVVFDEGKKDLSVKTNIAYLISKAEVGKANEFGVIDEDDKVPKVNVLLANGTVAIYELKDGGLGYGAVNAGGLYEYTLSGGKIVLKTLDLSGEFELNALTTPKFDHGTQRLSGGSGYTMVMNESSYFFVKYETDKYTVLKASELKSSIDTGKLGNTNFYADKGTVPYLHFGVLDLGVNKLPGTAVTTTEQYALLASSFNVNTVTEDDETFYQVSVGSKLLNGTDNPLVFQFKPEVENFADIVAFMNGHTKKVISYTLSNGVVKVADVADTDELVISSGTKAALKGVSGKNVFFTSDDYVGLLAKDVKVYVFDGTDLVAGDDTLYLAEGSAKNAYYVENDDDEITMIFTDVMGTEIKVVN